MPQLVKCTTRKNSSVTLSSIILTTKWLLVEDTIVLLEVFRCYLDKPSMEIFVIFCNCEKNGQTELRREFLHSLSWA